MRHKRHVAPSPLCSRCYDMDENLLHCFRDYRKVAPLWEIFPYLRDVNFKCENVFEWISHFVKGPDMILFLSVLWWVWKARNAEILAEDPWPTHVILQHIKDYLRWCRRCVLHLLPLSWIAVL